MKRCLGCIASAKASWPARRCSISIQCRWRVSWRKRNRHNTEREGYLQARAATRWVVRDCAEPIESSTPIRASDPDWQPKRNIGAGTSHAAQYEELLANPTYSSLKTSKTVNFDFLITYLIHPVRLCISDITAICKPRSGTLRAHSRH